MQDYNRAGLGRRLKLERKEGFGDFFKYKIALHSAVFETPSHMVIFGT